MVTLIRQIAAERARVGLSQNDLAEMLGVCRHTIRKYETGGDIPSSKLRIMAEYFKVSADYLLGIDRRPCAS